MDHSCEKPRKGANSFLVRLRKSVSGNALPIMAVALVPTMGMIGSGIDFGRSYLAKSKLQGAVDAAALAAVRTKQVSGSSNTLAIDTAKDYMAANYPASYLGANIQVPSVVVTDQNDIIRAVVTAQGTVPTTLLKVLGINTIDISVSATAEASETLPSSVEALLVLDNTGSMEGDRMTQLKSSARNFVDIIYGSKETRQNFAVGIIPYNTIVNVGHLVKAHSSSMVLSRPGFTNISATDKLGWKGCVFADPTVQNISSDPSTMDSGAFDIGDNMPGEGGTPALDPFIYPPIYVDSFENVNNRYSMPTSNRDDFYEIPTIREALVRLHGNNICVRKSDPSKNRGCDQTDSKISFDKLPDKDEYATARFYSHKSGNSKTASPNNQWGASPNYQCPSQALPLSYSVTKSDLINYINNENAALKPGTGTFHSPAMTWAYRMMSRDDVFPRARPSNLPVKKVVIFMTDGNFDSQDDGRAPLSGSKKVLDTAYTAYKTYEDRKMITTTSKNDTIEHLARRFAKTCVAMKTDGIEIYTIAFALGNDSAGNATREMFRNCATDRNTHFFSAANGAQLNDAFVTIAAELVDLRLTQ